MLKIMCIGLFSILLKLTYSDDYIIVTSRLFLLGKLPVDHLIANRMFGVVEFSTSNWALEGPKVFLWFANPFETKDCLLFTKVSDS